MLHKPKLVNFWELLEPSDQSLDDTYMQDSFIGPCKIALVCLPKYWIKCLTIMQKKSYYKEQKWVGSFVSSNVHIFRNVFYYLLHLQVIRFNAPDHAHLLVFWVLKCSLNLRFFFFFFGGEAKVKSLIVN